MFEVTRKEGSSCRALFFFFNDTATTEIYTLSLHDALPITAASATAGCVSNTASSSAGATWRSEEHTSELQSQFHIVCRLLLEKKKEEIDWLPEAMRILRDELPNIELSVS